MAANTVTEFLYNTTLTVVDFQHDPSGGTRQISVLGSQGTLKAAKDFCVKSLEKLGFNRSEFTEYRTRPAEACGSDEWPYGDGVMIFAKAPAGQVFLVGIVTTLNNENLASKPSGDLILPNGIKFLHYILQTTIDFNADRTGCAQSAELEGIYLHRADAWTAAYKCLNRDQFVQYDSRGDPGMAGQWPFGEDVAVHAISETGQNYYVSIKTPPFSETACKRGFVRAATKQPGVSSTQFLPIA